MTDTLNQITVFHGDLNSQLAHVYVRLSAAAAQSDWRLRGQILGPTNRLTRTLTATIDLQDLGPGDGLLARAIVPDPCFWAPGEPYLYSVRVELVAENRVLATEHRTLGLRRLGVDHRDIVLHARPWQLLGAHDGSVAPCDWEAWRRTALVRRTEAPSDLQCHQASLRGVLLIADLEPDVAKDLRTLEQELARLSRHASVAIVALPETAVVTPLRHTVAPNMLLAQHCAAADSLRLQPWADLVILHAWDPTELPAQLDACHLPVLVQYLRDDVTPVQVAAQRCHHMAQLLGPVPQIAGCLV